MSGPILQVALPSPLRRLFDYRAPAGLRLDDLQVGLRVRVPFGNRQMVGLIAAISEHSSVPAGKLKRADALIDHDLCYPRASGNSVSGPPAIISMVLATR